MLAFHERRWLSSRAAAAAIGPPKGLSPVCSAFPCLHALKILANEETLLL